ncbi:unnamed protein product [Rodentolepis nana]|uniref:Protein lev-9 n=1 Tax=Rodentolepis nana TaxID=102285 RepID=A0A0R3TJK1_RODNA|nr:unnamed protein product [Rodentolepis nana]
MDFLSILLLCFLESALTGLVKHRNLNIIAQPQRSVFALNRSLRPRGIAILEASALIDGNEAKAEGGAGDEVDAAAKIVCDPVGEGTSEFADCPKRTCRTNVDCWVAYGKPQQCVCDPHFCGLVCLPVGSQCPMPNKPENGNVLLRDSDVGGTADYICNAGFTVMGPRQRHCLATLKWSGPEPVCTNQTDFCFTPPYMPNAVVIEGHWLEGKTSSDRADYRNGETITMTCRPGFADTKRRYSTLVCLGNQWKYEKLDCQRISCSEIEGPKNGRTLYTSDMRFQATAIQFCDDGYNIRCSEETENIEPSSAKSCRRVCQEDGVWSGKSAECIAVTCPKLHQPENGFISGYQTSVNSVVAFECAEGYELTGSKFRKCQANGKWDGEQVNCLDGTLDKGKVKIGALLEHGSSISVSCQSGFNLAEELKKPLKSPFATTLCKNGNWNRKYECQPARCTTRPPNIPNALTRFYGLHHGSVVRYQCFPGYELNTNRTEALLRSEVKNGGLKNSWPLSHDHYSVKCEYGVWKGEPPICVQGVS